MEIYPMPMFPTLSVADVRTSMEWYADTLGFALVFAMPGTDGETVLAHLRWRKHADLLLVPDARGPQAARPKGLGVALSFLAGPTSVDDMAAGHQGDAGLARGGADQNRIDHRAPMPTAPSSMAVSCNGRPTTLE